MITKNSLLLTILVSGLIATTALPMNDGFHTPPRKQVKRICPSSEERDPTFQPGPTPPSERKRLRVSKTSISSPCVKAWPQLFGRHELNQGFMGSLAKTQLKDGTTMLHKAMKQHIITRSTISCITDMIDSGADLAAKQGKDQDTPLHMWAMRGICNTIEALKVKEALKHRQCPDVEDLKNINGSTPLHLLCSKGLVDSAKFKILAKWGISLTTQNYQRQTILHRLAQAGPDINEQKARILSFLDQRDQYDLSGIINKKDYWGRTALYCAVKEGDIATFDFLTQVQGINLNNQDNNGNTALHAAAKNAGKRNKNAKYFIKKLVRLGASKELRNDYDQHPRDLVADRYTGLKAQLS